MAVSLIAFELRSMKALEYSFINDVSMVCSKGDICSIVVKSVSAIEITTSGVGLSLMIKLSVKLNLSATVMLSELYSSIRFTCALDILTGSLK